MIDYKEINEKVQSLIEKSESKEDITTLGAIKDAVSAAEAEHEKTVSENKELLTSYKDLIKHTSFAVKDSEEHGAPSAPPTFESVLDDYIKQKKEK